MILQKFHKIFSLKKEGYSCLHSKSAPFQGAKNGTADGKTKKQDHFLMTTSPQNGGLHVSSMHLPLLGGF